MSGSDISLLTVHDTISENGIILFRWSVSSGFALFWEMFCFGNCFGKFVNTDELSDDNRQK